MRVRGNLTQKKGAKAPSFFSEVMTAALYAENAILPNLSVAEPVVFTVTDEGYIDVTWVPGASWVWSGWE